MALSVEAQSLLRRTRAEVVAGKGHYELLDDPAKHCLVGFIDTEESYATREEVLSTLRSVLRERTPELLWRHIEYWNDRPDTTEQDIVALIDDSLRKGVQVDS